MEARVKTGRSSSAQLNVLLSMQSAALVQKRLFRAWPPQPVGGRPGRPPPADSAEGVAYFFFGLHFWTDVELLLEPSEKDSVPVLVHFFFLHRAMT
jgi:hypothetical protein